MGQPGISSFHEGYLTLFPKAYANMFPWALIFAGERFREALKTLDSGGEIEYKETYSLACKRQWNTIVSRRRTLIKIRRKEELLEKSDIAYDSDY